MKLLLNKNIILFVIIGLLFLQQCDEIHIAENKSLDNYENLTDTINCQFNSIHSAYSSCLTELSDTTLDVVTWNLKFFPINGNATLGLLEDIIPNMNADIIAIQEINNISDFNLLLKNLNGWQGEVINVNGSLDLGYIYKECEIEVLENSSIVLSESVEPRPAVRIKIRHKSTGLEITLFNIHLKCCGVTGSDDANRREAASKTLQSYINNNLSNENIIVLGDWNDDIHDGPFENFLNDTNFTFADEEIANGSSNNWSYPSWPSHLDHILISKGLFDNFLETKTIKLDSCINNVESNISDHRAVMTRFE